MANALPALYEYALQSENEKAMISPDAPKMIDRLARFVAINTENPPGQEAAGARFLAGELRGLGFEVETREELPGRANVIARLDNGPGPCFAFNSHIDVVPAGSGWTQHCENRRTQMLHPEKSQHANNGKQDEQTQLLLPGRQRHFVLLPRRHFVVKKRDGEERGLGRIVRRQRLCGI